ncbi:unnamed protein product, partial [Didymodactylos carnosus]
ALTVVVFELMANSDDLLEKVSEAHGKSKDDIELTKQGLSECFSLNKTETKRETSRHVDEVIDNVAHGTNINSGSRWPTAEYCEINIPMKFRVALLPLSEGVNKSRRILT